MVNHKSYLSISISILAPLAIVIQMLQGVSSSMMSELQNRSYYSSEHSMNDPSLGIFRSHERLLQQFMTVEDMHTHYNFTHAVKRTLDNSDSSIELLQTLEGRYGPMAFDHLSIPPAFPQLNLDSKVHSVDKHGSKIPLALLDREFNFRSNRNLSSSDRHSPLYSRESTEFFARLFRDEPVTAEDCDVCIAHYTAAYDKFMETAEQGVLDLVLPLCDKLWPSLLGLSGKEYCNPEIKNECQDLCQGMVRSWSGVVAEVLASLLHDPDLNCQKNGACPVPDWDTIPAVYPATTVKSIGKAPGGLPFSMMHITDVHVDRNYERGAIVECGMPVCCHSKYGSPGPIHGASPFGEYECDAPDTLVLSSLDEVKKHQPKHLIFTGDAPAHDLWLQTKDLNLGTMMNVTSWSLQACGYDESVSTQIDDMIEKLANNHSHSPVFSHFETNTDIDIDGINDEEDYDEEEDVHSTPLRTPTTLYWPSIGNHAAAPVDQFGGPAKDAWLYGPLAKAWGAFIPNDSNAKATLAWGGYYTAPMQPGLHMISLQTNYYDSINLYLHLGSKHWDMAGQLSWFADVLGQIEALGEKAIIIAHENPRDFATGIWPVKFVSILEKYAKTISGLYFGHIHNDVYHVVRTRDRETSPTGLTSAEEAMLLEKEYFAQKRLNSAEHLITRLGIDRSLQNLSGLRFSSSGSLVSSVQSTRFNTARNLINTAKFTLAEVAQARVIGMKRVNTRLVNLRALGKLGLAALVSNPVKLGKELNVIHIPSSLTPNQYETNPSFRIYTIDSTDFSHIDYRQFRFDLMEGKKTGRIEWKTVYSARKHFDLSNLSPSQWSTFAYLVAHDESTYHKYVDVFKGGLHHEKTEPMIVDLGPVETMCFLNTCLPDEYDYCVKAHKAAGIYQ